MHVDETTILSVRFWARDHFWSLKIFFFVFSKGS